MEFNEADLREFIEIWKEEFHETITEATARLSASALMELLMLLMTPEENP